MPYVEILIMGGYKVDIYEDGIMLSGKSMEKSLIITDECKSLANAVNVTCVEVDKKKLEFYINEMLKKMFSDQRNMDQDLLINDMLVKLCDLGICINRDKVIAVYPVEK